MHRLWQDPADDMYFRTVGEVQRLPKPEDEYHYRCNPTIWCETVEDAFAETPMVKNYQAIREIGAYNLIAEGNTLDELKLIMLLES
ncbi:hypothetical protein HYP06_gp078 [Vibrio phage vB_VspP_pVa5]|uniref:Uncharacterized protein n=1 Tax=Vibrio phage vB_VspP_pVa5 TaxID=1913109 RepID=A0A1J0GV82_9CAUD|nr:hypothetical protein HYP06_gp078 [Vibrio phage vB_VspP_pVa5]APC46086.1 hypothetical protein vBVspPpVa5_0095 [Vibrio phage vB_VspP_pVa5]